MKAILIFYESPIVEMLDLEVEQGFAQSNVDGVGNSPLDNEGWD